MTPNGATLRLKLAAFIATLALSIVAAVSTGLIALRHHEVDDELQRKARLYARLLASQLESAVAYDDHATAREVLNSVSIDPDVQRVALYGSDHVLIEGSEPLPPKWATDPDKVELLRAPHALEVVAPVVTHEGPRGTVYVTVGTGRMERALRGDLLVSLIAALGVMLFATLAAWLIAGAVARRLGRMAQVADRVARGDFAHEPLEPGSLDEIGRLTVGFNVMIARLQSEQSRLKELVDARTAELNQRNHELETNREQYRQIVETTNAIPFVWDVDTNAFTYVGPQAQPLLGYPLEDWCKPGFLRGLMTPADVEALRASTSAAIAKNAPYDFESRLPAIDGRTVHLRITATTDGGRVRGLMLDVTERKHLESELQQSQKLESIGRLASGVAHEINTPVQFISDSVHFVRDGWTDAASLLVDYRALAREVAKDGASAERLRAIDEKAAAIDLDYVLENVPPSTERALEGLSRIAKIVASMKAFAHADQNERVAFDVNEGIESTLTIARNEYKYVADVDVELGEVPHVHGRPGELNQVVLSLIVNAAQAIADVVKDSGKRGRITVRSARESDRVVISVTDTGSGIPDAIRGKVFEQFFTTKPVGKGTGQGLSMARSIVRSHGGELTFDSTVGQSTTFRISLPISRQGVGAAA